MPVFKKHSISDIVSAALLFLSIVCLLLALNLSPYSVNSRTAAQKVQKVLDGRMAMLDAYVDAAAAGNVTEWMELDGLPEDMVVYRYVNDSLQSWANRFTVNNDDIGSKVMFQLFTNQRVMLSSPLADVTDVPQLMNLGPNWYLVYSRTAENCKVIAGLEIMSDQAEVGNGVNPLLKLGSQFSVKPLSTSGGYAVYHDEVPQFKILFDTFRTYTLSKSYMVWVALLLFVLAALIFLSGSRSLKRFEIVISALVAVLTGMYFFGMRLQDESDIFSPTLYADGTLFYSLGAIIIINLFVTLLVGCTYMVRGELYRDLIGRRKKPLFVIASIADILLIAGIFVYSFHALKSIIYNSSINLELYMFNGVDWYTLLVYLSFISLLLAVPLLVQLLRPALKSWLGLHFESMSKFNLALFSLISSAFLLLVTATFGLRKEQDRAALWANRLTIDRDITLELELRSAENEIASDILLGTLAVLNNTNSIVLNRIMENYLSRLTHDYDASVFILNQDNDSPEVVSYITSRLRDGSPISDASRFLYSTSSNGHPSYRALFTYFSNDYGASSVLLEIEPKANKDDRGFSTLLGFSSPGRASVPARYSYAKYVDERLVTYRGSYPYPRLMSSELRSSSSGAAQSNGVKNSFTHFINRIDDHEVVVISRSVTPIFRYLLAFVFVALILYVALMLLSSTRKRKPVFEKSYYKTRVTTVLVASLVTTLVSLALVSVIFVYKRNDANRQTMISEKITSLQTMVEARCRGVRDFTELASQEFSAVLESVSNMTSSDIMLFTPDGVAFKSTTQEVLDNMLFGSRIDGNAFRDIVYNGSRYYIGNDEINGHEFYALYAPVYNDAGNMVAILSSPYITQNYDFEMEAVMHSIAILTVFLILLIIARILIVNIVDRMFKPLIEMGRKMNASDVDSLEYLEYDRDDEISSLVKSYNRMVTDLSDSTRKLAQAERDKAWSGMARQVAHEIKNPLTPMKLQLQRLIRLKQKNDPSWQDKFDEVAEVVLDHIDILSETANEFSTFAKLYSEEPALIDLDSVLREEIAMFDTKENVSFSYMGLKEAMVMGPKPQLTRVFVNLISNAVQAVEEQGSGSVMVSLRNSTSGSEFYDIVVEDSGPGVAHENVDKLFTPNFTTKSSGTGLGLAISRSILEKCGASISYSRSFTLGGACFTIVYPKK